MNESVKFLDVGRYLPVVLRSFLLLQDSYGYLLVAWFLAEFCFTFSNVSHRTMRLRSGSNTDAHPDRDEDGIIEVAAPPHDFEGIPLPPPQPIPFPPPIEQTLSRWFSNTAMISGPHEISFEEALGLARAELDSGLGWTFDPALQQVLAQELILTTNLYGSPVNHAFAPYYSSYGARLEVGRYFGFHPASHYLGAEEELRFFANPPFNSNSVLALGHAIQCRLEAGLETFGIVILADWIYERVWQPHFDGFSFSHVACRIPQQRALYKGDFSFHRQGLDNPPNWDTFVLVVSTDSTLLPVELISQLITRSPVVEVSAEVVEEANSEPVVETPAAVVEEALSDPELILPSSPVVETPAEVVEEDISEPTLIPPSSPVVEAPAQATAEDSSPSYHVFLSHSTVMASETGDLLGRVAWVIVPDTPNADDSDSPILASATIPITLSNMNRAKDQLRIINQLLNVGICAAYGTLVASVGTFRLSFHCSTKVDTVFSQRWPLIWKGGKPVEKQAQRDLNGFLTTVLNTSNHLCAGLGLPEELTDQFRAEFPHVPLDAVFERLQELRASPLAVDMNFPESDPGRDYYTSFTEIWPALVQDWKPCESVLQNRDPSLLRAFVPTTCSILETLYPHILSLRIQHRAATFKRLPKAVKSFRATFQKICDECVSSDSSLGWYKLMCFGPLVCFRLQDLNVRLQMWDKGEYFALFDQAFSFATQENSNPLDPTEVVANQINEGRLSLAYRNQTEPGTLASGDNAYEKLLDLHPQAQLNSSEFPVPDRIEPLTFTKTDLQQCLFSVQSGSSPGLSGLRIDWLKRCWAGSSSGFRDSFLRLITKIAHGDIPSSACHLMRASLLIALEKPGGGVRPIAITDVTRRLASKLIMTKLPDKAEKVSPFQFGIDNRIDVAAGTIERAYEDPDSEAILSIDCKNAYNSADREKILTAVTNKCPQILKTVLQLYLPEDNCDNAVLHTNLGPPISSTRGVAQGDNMSPFLFCLALAPILLSLTGDPSWPATLFLVAYMDDITLVGKLKDIEEQFPKLKQALEAIGLEVNLKKTKLQVKNGIDNVPPGFCGLEPDSITTDGIKVIGVPFGPELFQRTFLDKLFTKLTRELDKVLELGSYQHQFLLLHYCWSKKSNYLLRCLDLKFTTKFAKQLNDYLLEKLQDKWGVRSLDAFPADLRKQITLPIRNGGCHLGICEATIPAVRFAGLIHSFPRGFQPTDAFLSSPLGKKICDLYQTLQGRNLTTLQTYSTLEAMFGTRLQRSLCREIHTQLVQQLTEKSPYRMAALTQYHHAGDWLLARPSFPALTLTPAEWCKAIKLRLGFSFLIPGHSSMKCSCGRDFDDKGWHIFTCRKQTRRWNGRHNRLCEAWTNIFQAAGLDVFPETPMAVLSDDPSSSSSTLRPDHLVPHYSTHGGSSRAAHLATDVSIVMPWGNNTVECREQTKRHKYEDKLAPLPGLPPFDTIPIDFMPLVANAFGGWSDTSVQLIRLLSQVSHVNTHKFVKPEYFTNYAWRLLSVTLQKTTASFHTFYEQLVLGRIQVVPRRGHNLGNSTVPSDIQLDNNPPLRG